MGRKLDRKSHKQTMQTNASLCVPHFQFGAGCNKDSLTLLYFIAFACRFINNFQCFFHLLFLLLATIKKHNDQSFASRCIVITFRVSNHVVLVVYGGYC